MIDSILLVQFMCLRQTVLFYNLSPGLVSLSVWDLLLHTLHISSPNHQLLFATHAHTIPVCFTVVPTLCHLFLNSLSSLLGYLSFTLMQYIHLTILISAS